MKFGKCESRKYNLLFVVSFVLYINVFSISLRFSMYEPIKKLCVCNVLRNIFSEMTGIQNLICFISKLLLRPWDLSHRVERQKIMVTSQEETAVRLKNGLRIEGVS